MTPKSIGRFIVMDPGVCHGKPTFWGTRILDSDVLGQVAEGRDWQTTIEEWHGSISKLVGTYQIGGYKVLDKWLDSYKERILSLEDIHHFCLTATALHHTIQFQKKIDEMYLGAE